jgi:hypothetical protein
MNFILLVHCIIININDCYRVYTIRYLIWSLTEMRSRWSSNFTVVIDEWWRYYKKCFLNKSLDYLNVKHFRNYLHFVFLLLFLLWSSIKYTFREWLAQHKILCGCIYKYHPVLMIVILLTMFSSVDIDIKLMIESNAFN